MQSYMAPFILGKETLLRGSVTTNFCKITLNATMPGQTLTALSNTCTRAASAQLVAQGNTLTIADKDTGNDSCRCQ